MQSIQTVGIIGAGTMGNGIAQACATCGIDVVMVDINQAAVDKGLATVSGSLDRLIKKEKLTADQKTAALARIKTSTEMRALVGSQLVIEAATENETLKVQILQQLDQLLPADTLIASNTSSISITKLAAATSRPNQFIGMHFFNPVPLMQLVEVIRGELTSEATRDVVVEVARRMGKTPLEVQDYPGFISNRLLMPMINEAIEALREGVATKEAIDGIMRLGMNHPMGPLELADFIGLDTCLAIMEVLHRGFGDDKYRPSPLLRRMVQAGLLGRKAGRGFYTYDEKGNKVG